MDVMPTLVKYMGDNSCTMSLQGKECRYHLINKIFTCNICIFVLYDVD